MVPGVTLKPLLHEAKSHSVWFCSVCLSPCHSVGRSSAHDLSQCSYILFIFYLKTAFVVLSSSSQIFFFCCFYCWSNVYKWLVGPKHPRVSAHFRWLQPAQAALATNCNKHDNPTPKQQSAVWVDQHFKIKSCHPFLSSSKQTRAHSYWTSDRCSKYSKMFKVLCSPVSCSHILSLRVMHRSSTTHSCFGNTIQITGFWVLFFFGTFEQHNSQLCIETEANTERCFKMSDQY